MPELIHLKIENGKLILGDLQLRGIEEYEIKISSRGPKGTAELNVKMLVNFADSMQGQNPLPTQKEPAEKQN